MSDWFGEEPSLGERVDAFLADLQIRLWLFSRPTDSLRLGRLAGAELRAHGWWPVGLRLLKTPTFAWVLALLRPGWPTATYVLWGVLLALLHEVVGILPHELAHVAATRVCRYTSAI